jgi:hypothetical protein
MNVEMASFSIYTANSNHKKHDGGGGGAPPSCYNSTVCLKIIDGRGKKYWNYPQVLYIARTVRQK